MSTSAAGRPGSGKEVLKPEVAKETEKKPISKEVGRGTLGTEPTVAQKGQDQNIGKDKSLLGRVMELKSEGEALVRKKSTEFNKLMEDLKKNINEQLTAENLANHPSTKPIRDLIAKITEQLTPEKLAKHASIKPLLNLMQDLINAVKKKPELAEHASIKPLLDKMQKLIDKGSKT